MQLVLRVADVYVFAKVNKKSNVLIRKKLINLEFAINTKDGSHGELFFHA